MTTRISLISLSLFIGFSVQANGKIQALNNDTLSLNPVKDSIFIHPDDPVIAAMDQLLLEDAMSYVSFTNDTACLNIYGFEPHEIPKYEEEDFIARLAELDQKTPFDLRYNSQVKAFINLYTNQKRELTSRILGLAEYYYPMFEEKLDQFDIPLEMKHLAVVESALNPRAHSRAGAKGLWQFMYQTGKMYGLEVNSYVDERQDPYASTIAACRYLKYLHGIYDDWNLALAAYNSGPGNVNKAIRRSGGKKDYWSILNYLPRETRGYVPAFIAVNYVMEYYREHNLYPVTPPIFHAEMDTVVIDGPLTFEQVSKYTGVSMEELEFLNPVCKSGYIPPMEKSFVMYLPTRATGVFLANQDSIFAPPKLPTTIAEPVAAINNNTANATYHTVRNGEVLGTIARRYGVSVQKIKEWNNIAGSRIYAGQKLAINQYKSNNTPILAKQEKPKTTGSSDYLYHIVQPGDTLWDIAKKYDGVSMDEIKKVNNNINYTRLKPGQKIKIPPVGT